MSQDLLNKRKQGFTLLEIVISMMIFAAVVLSLSYPFVESVSLSMKDSSMTSANNLARLYLRDLEAKWRFQADYDEAVLLPITSTYTDNGKYEVTVTPTDLATNDDSKTIIRRVVIVYKNKQDGKLLTDICLDYNRPGSGQV